MSYIHSKPYRLAVRDLVVFREFIDNDEDMIDHFLGDVMSNHIVGLEEEDGSVTVYKNGLKLKRPLRNKKIFIEKYFAKAI
mgnify:CR=1 FL=1